MGKTTIAQHVSSDERVKNHFPLRMWVCVAEVFVVKTVVEQIIKQLEIELKTVEQIKKSATNNGPNTSKMDPKEKLRHELKVYRHLLVLDDVWNEDYSTWHDLKVLLGVGAKGSRIIVTTRSTVVANVTGDPEPYHLGKLDDGFSWSLFKRMACRKENEGNKSIEDMREKILKKCGGIPVVIKTMGSMLRFKNTETEWQLFIDKELSKVPQYADNILPRLELSYNHLPSHLKHCFAYCSLFPKDHEFDVQEMIRFWMALGFVNSPDQNQPLEDVGFEYFKELLSRSFFQQVQTNKWGDIISCKMHDFIHDLAIKVAGTECFSFNNSEGRNIGKRTRHVSFDYEQSKSKSFLVNLLQAERIRSIFNSCFLDEPTLNKIISSLKRIRLLDLNGSYIENVPKSIAQLMHLRYLNLSNSHVTTLPNSLCRLQNLQTLLLNSCDYFQKWPKDFGKLVNLRHLDFSHSHKVKEWPEDMQKLVNLRHLKFEINVVLMKSMPCGLSQLTNLQTLSPLKIDVVSSEFGIAQMGELNNLRGGEFKIVNLSHEKYETSKANLKKKKFDSIELQWLYNVEVDEATATTDETTLEDLQPHQNLKELSLDFYCGNKCCWSWFASLINVVRVQLYNCTNLQYLPQLAHLPALKELKLDNLPALVYISSNNSDELICRPSSSSSRLKSFFPSLKELRLENMPSLKGWWNINNEDNNHLKLPEFPCLSRLKIMQCPGLSCMPLFPSLDGILHLEGTTTSWMGALQSTLKMKDIEGGGPQIQNDAKSQNQNSTTSHGIHIEGASTTSSISSNTIPPLSKLKEMILKNIEDVESLPASSNSMISLKHLLIRSCSKLKSISPGICSLTSLEELVIFDCPVFDSLPEEISSLISLKELSLDNLPKLKSLPQHRFLANIQQVEYCDDRFAREFKPKPGVFQSQAKDYPTNLQNLTLMIWDCPHLEGFIRNSGFFVEEFE